MGVYAETSGAVITCKNREIANNVAKILIAQAKASDENQNDFAQDVLADGDCFVYFNASSGRIQNLEWQIEKIWEAIKDIDGVEELSAPFLIEGDGAYYSKDI